MPTRARGWLDFRCSWLATNQANTLRARDLPTPQMLQVIKKAGKNRPFVIVQFISPNRENALIFDRWVFQVRINAIDKA